METDQNGPFLLQCKEALRECGIPPVVNTYSGHVEGWIFDAAQIETVVFGPGPILQNAFRPNEYTLTQHLSRATAFYERVIRKLCT